MKNFAYLSPTLAVAGALTKADFAEIAKLGFKSIINNRPDGEETGQLTTREEAVLSWRAGVAYRHVPAAKHEVLDQHVLEPLADALRSMPGPVLLHCRSGLRSSIMWAALSVASGASIDDVLASAKAAGQDLEVVREEIASHATATRGHPVGRPCETPSPKQAAA